MPSETLAASNRADLVTLRAAGSVATGPSWPLAAGAAIRPDHLSSPLGATYKFKGLASKPLFVSTIRTSSGRVILFLSARGGKAGLRPRELLWRAKLIVESIKSRNA